jgi:hypothetical protein
VKNSLILRNAEGPKNSLSSLSRNDLNIPSERWSHHTMCTRDLVIHLLGHYGPPFSGCGRLFSGCERLDDSSSHLQHYINKRVGVKFPPHLLSLYCCAAEKFDHSRSLFIIFSIKASLCFSFVTRGSFGKDKKIINFVKTQEIQHQMVRVRSTARVTRDGEETEAAETAPISEVMRQSGLVVPEGASDEGAPAAEAEEADIEEGDASEEEIDYNTTMPSKPSHLDFGKSIVSKADMPMMTNLGYFGEAERKLIRFGGEETIPKPENDEVIVF